MAKLLLVDDDNRFRQGMAELLTLYGHEVQVAADGLAAIHILRKGEPFDLILSDYQMPVMDGVELLRAAKDDSRFAEIPFLMHSGDDDARASEWCSKLGATFRRKSAEPSIIEWVAGALQTQTQS